MPYTQEQIEEAKQYARRVAEESKGLPKHRKWISESDYIAILLAALKVTEKERDYERGQKQYYIGVGAELRSKLTEAQHEITKDIQGNIANIHEIDRLEKALAYAKTDNVDLKERVEGAKNGIKTLVDQRERLTAYISKLEKAGDDMRESSDGSILHRDAIREWDAVRKEKP